jgi:hypothetical protein
MNREKDPDPKTVECPTCKAKPGVDCDPYPHMFRVYAALREEAIKKGKERS